jgi:hypothetical protein
MLIGLFAADKPYPGSNVVAAGDDPDGQIGKISEICNEKADEDDLTEQLLLSTRRSLPQRGGRA